MFKLFKRKITEKEPNLETLAERGFITKTEMLLLKKERAVKEYNDFIKEKPKRGKKI